MAREHSNGYAPVDSEELGHHRTHSEEVRFASLVEKKRLWWRNAVINTLFITSWFAFATVLSVYNKWMFSPDHFGFPSPLFVTSLHMLVQFMLSAFLRSIWPQRFRPPQSPSSLDYLRKAVPTGITTSLDIGLSNLSLKLITLSFYTMCKSSSLIFVLIFAFMFRLERFSYVLVGVIMLICAGVLLMVATETHFVLTGFLLIMSSSALSGFRWSLTQLLLRSKNIGLDNPVATLFWLSPIMAATLILLTIVLDGPAKTFSNHFFTAPELATTLFFLFAPGVVAFCMVLSEFYILQRAGVVPMSITGIAKEVTTITISAWFFGDELTPLNITGVAITTCGIALYTYHKYRRSMDSSVPLDAHGNPVEPGADAESEGEPAADGHIRLEEAQRLAGGDSRTSFDAEHSDQELGADPAAARPELLFDVGSDSGDEGDAGARPPRAGIAGASDPAAHPPLYQVDGSAGGQDVWAR